MTDVDSLAPIIVASRTLLGLVFLTAAVGKLRDLGTFHAAVHAYRLLPHAFVGSAAIIIPSLEVVLGLLLPSGLTPIGSAAAAIAVLGLFATAMTINILRGRRDIDCGCFRNRPSRQLTWAAVARTMALAATALVSGLAANTSMATSTEGIVAGAILFLLFVTASTLPTYGRMRPRISL